jgi:hypothetical protein
MPLADECGGVALLMQLFGKGIQFVALRIARGVVRDAIGVGILTG